MKVLHLPANIASQPSALVRASRDLGVDARVLAVNATALQSWDGVELHRLSPIRRQPLLGLAQRTAWWRKATCAMRWADVIHWHYGRCVLPCDMELRYAARLGKPRLVHFWGSDIRDPALASQDNPYARSMYEQHPDYAARRQTSSAATQARFARYGFGCVVPDRELAAYVRLDLFPAFHTSRVCLVLSDFQPHLPEPANARPVVVHAPSRQMLKGTDAVQRAVAQLGEDHDFEFRLVADVPRPQAMAIMRDCDIVLDQFTLGTHGVVALEAMAWGKPVVCYIKPSLIDECPEDYPVVNASQDGLADQLARLLTDGALRHELGLRGRAYVERHHSAHAVAQKLLALDEQLIDGQGRA